jgi:hypothetical protein
MKTTIVTLAAASGFAILLTLSAAADDLQALSGKWVAERTDSQGRSARQVLEIKKDKFIFKVLRDGDQVALYAEGEVKTEQLGPFNAARFYKIQGGTSASDLQPVEDDRTLIYTLADNELTVAANFDKERSEPASVTKYTKAAAEAPKTLVIDKIVMHTTPQTAEWYLCFEAAVGDATKRFNIPNKTYEKDEVTIPTELAIANVRKDQTCKFVVKLDDVAGDECADEMDNRSTGSFTVTESGSQAYKPEDHWRYTIYWHLK